MWWKILLVSVGLMALSCRAEYISEADEIQLLEKALYEFEQEREREREQVPEGRFAAEDDVSPSDQEFGERMYRDRKEGQISVYNYGPSIRDQEYLEHSSLWGHQYVAGGAGEGLQRLKPDGSGRNVQVVKSDAVLPAYCNPPNPCPIGYTADDGCLEEFENTAAFCREYQQQQECMCDTEHMFDCPGSTKDDEVNTLAQQISNEGLVESALDRIAHKIDATENTIPVEGEHKSLVAKKFFNKETHEEYTRMLSEKNRNQAEEQRLKSRAKRSVRKSETAKSFKKFNSGKFGKKRNSTKTDLQQKQPNKNTKLTINPYLQGEKLPVVAKKG